MKVTNDEVTRAAMIGHLEAAMAKVSLFESLICTKDFSLDRNLDSLHYLMCDIGDGIAYVLEGLQDEDRDAKSA